MAFLSAHTVTDMRSPIHLYWPMKELWPFGHSQLIRGLIKDKHGDEMLSRPGPIQSPPLNTTFALLFPYWYNYLGSLVCISLCRCILKGHLFLQPKSYETDT